MYMPHSSNPLNDHAVMSAYVPLLEHAAPPVYSRAALGLPEDAVILANFNNPYKVDAVGVRAWAAALRRAGRGVIWMPEWEGLQSNAQLMRQLLLQEGVGWNAVVTTPLLPRDNHLLGRQLSDVGHPPPPLPFVWRGTFVSFLLSLTSYSPQHHAPHPLAPSGCARYHRIQRPRHSCGESLGGAAACDSAW